MNEPLPEAWVTLVSMRRRLMTSTGEGGWGETIMKPIAPVGHRYQTSLAHAVRYREGVAQCLARRV